MANEEKTITINNNTLTYILFGLLLVSAFAIGMLWTKVQDTERTGQGPTPSANAGAGAPATTKLENVTIDDSDHVRGGENARVALIEYSDMECPFCVRHHPTVQRIVDEYDGEVAWVYRHFPLDQLHPNARKLAEGSECAAKLGGSDAFWAYTDEVFNGTYTDAELDLKALANKAGVDADALFECVDSGELADAVSEDEATGSSYGVTGTPGNVIVNLETGEAELVSGAVSFAQLKQVIDSYLN